MWSWTATMWTGTESITSATGTKLTASWRVSGIPVWITPRSVVGGAPVWRSSWRWRIDILRCPGMNCRILSPSTLIVWWICRCSTSAIRVRWCTGTTSWYDDIIWSYRGVVIIVIIDTSVWTFAVRIMWTVIAIDDNNRARVIASIKSSKATITVIATKSPAAISSKSAGHIPAVA